MFETQSFMMAMCTLGLVGPVMLWTFERVLARPVAGFRQVAQGSGLMVLAGIALGASGWAQATSANYLGCLLLIGAGAYWYEGTRQLCGMPDSNTSTRQAVAIYSIGLGLLSFWGDQSSSVLAYNAVACSMVLLVCMDVGLRSRVPSRAQRATALLIGSGALLFFVQGIGLAGGGAHGIALIEQLGTAIAIGIYLTTQGAMIGFAVIASEQVQRTLEREASIDSLSGVLIRSELMKQADQEMQRCAREGRSIGCLMMDIDHFKRVNDTYGHQKGDEVIADFARKVSAAVRPYDLVGRYGGEEFVAILPGATEQAAHSIGERIRRLAQTSAEGIPDYTVSIGICCREKGPIKAMIGLADEALYEAKRTGRNKLCVANAATASKAPLSLVSARAQTR